MTEHIDATLEPCPTARPESDETGYSHPLIEGLLAFSAQADPADPAALDTIYALTIALRCSVEAMGPYDGPPMRGVAAHSFGAGVKLRDAISAIRFAGQFIGEAREIAMRDRGRRGRANPAAPDRPDTEGGTPR